MTHTLPQTPELEKEVKIFTQRIIKFATELVRMGCNYGWSEDTIARELYNLLSQTEARVRREVVEEVKTLLLPYVTTFGYKNYIVDDLTLEDFDSLTTKGGEV